MGSNFGHDGENDEKNGARKKGKKNKKHENENEKNEKNETEDEMDGNDTPEKYGKIGKMEKLSSFANTKVNVRSMVEKISTSNSTSFINMIKKEEEDIAKKITEISFFHERKERLRVANRRRKTIALSKSLMIGAKDNVLRSNDFLIQYYIQEKQNGETLFFFAFYFFFRAAS